MNVSDEVRFRVSPEIIGNQNDQNQRKVRQKTAKHTPSKKTPARKRTTSGNDIRFQAVVTNEGLIELDLSHRKLNTLQHEVFTLGRLEVLNISHNQLHGIPKEISSLRQLKRLDCSWNSIAVIPLTLANLKHLKELNLSNNNIHILPSEMTSLYQLRVLKIGFNKLQRLPQNIGELTSLKQLELPGNQIWFLPPSFGKLKKLKYLNIGSNKLDQVPISACNLCNLQALDLHGNTIISLPQEIAQLKKLSELNLADNKFIQLPVVVSQIKQLSSLDITKNKLQSLPEEIHRLSKLKMLNAQGNLLQTLPQIPSLLYLNIADNRVQNMSLSKAKSLKYLNCNSNYLQNMPLGIYNQKYLESLKLRDNQINYVSQDIVLLQKLKCLDLGNNYLQSLPQVIYDLENLLSFNIKGNPIDKKLGKNGMPARMMMQQESHNVVPNNDVNFVPREAHYIYPDGGNQLAYGGYHMQPVPDFRQLPSNYKNNTHRIHRNLQSSGNMPRTTATTPNHSAFIRQTQPFRDYQEMPNRPTSGHRNILHRAQPEDRLQRQQPHIQNNQYQPFAISPMENSFSVARVSSLWPNSYHGTTVNTGEDRRTPFDISRSGKSTISNYSNAATAAESETIGDDISLGDQDFQFQPTSVKDRRLKGLADEVETMLKQQLLDCNR